MSRAGAEPWWESAFGAEYLSVYAHRDDAQAGREVVVLERSIPGAEASSAAGGILSPGVEAEPGPFHDLCEQSLGRWPGFAEEVERLSGTWIGFRAGGTLEVSLDDRFTPVLAGRAAQLEKAGIDVEVLDGEGARRLEPGLSPETRGALYFPSEASVDPRLLGRALHAAAARAGARFVAANRVLMDRNTHVGFIYQVQHCVER